MPRARKYPEELIQRGVRLAIESGRPVARFRDRLFSRMIVGGQLAGNMRTTLVLDALRMALGSREPGADFELVAHTDAGPQYTSCDYTQILEDHRLLASIGTVGDALDNALAESFVDSYKTELIAGRVWRTRTQLELASVEWVGWFSHRRLHERSATSRRSSSSRSTSPPTRRTA